MMKTNNGRLWSPTSSQLLILDGPSTDSRGSGRLWRCAAAYSVKLPLVFQKRYLPDHLPPTPADTRYSSRPHALSQSGNGPEWF